MQPTRRRVNRKVIFRKRKLYLTSRPIGALLPEMTARQISALRPAYNRGEPLSAISLRTGISKGALSELLRALGCAMRARGRAKKVSVIKSK